MNKQNVFNFDFETNNNSNFYLNETNNEAYKGIHVKQNKNIYLIGPPKSGKSYLGNKTSLDNV